LGRKGEQEEAEASREETSHNERKYYKSEMTPEDLEKIRHIKLLQKKYEAELDNKAKLYEESLRRFHDEERELLERQKREKNEERKKEVARNLEEIRLRQEERKHKLEEESRRIQEIKNEKKLYERLDEQFRSGEAQEGRKKEELKLALKLQKNVHFDEIKEHEKRYDEIMRVQREERGKKLGELAKGNSKKYYQSRLLKDCLEQEERVRAEPLERKNEVKQHFLKKEEYAEYVRNNYRPQAKEEGEKEEKEAPSNRSLSVHELHKIGNDYMKQVHENAQNLKGSSVSKVVERKEEPFRYRDYLQDIKAERKLSSQKESRYLEQIDSLMRRENMTQEEKFFKAKLIADRLEERKGRDSQKLIESINAKIYLLKRIEPAQ
jgi:hypothetical protein